MLTDDKGVAQVNPTDIRLANFVPRPWRPQAARARRKARQWVGGLSSQRRRGTVAMLHIGRCGSTVLANMLADHPDICWDGKIVRKAQGLYGKDLSRFDYALWTRQQFAISGSRYYGFEFKILPDQYSNTLGIQTADFLRTCQQIGVTHYLVLRRANTVRQVVSHYASIARGTWHATGSGEVKPKRFRLNCDAVTTGGSAGWPLADYLELVDAAYRETHELLAGERALAVQYESDIESDGPVVAYRKICDFLAIAAPPVKIKNKKLNPPEIRQIVENYADLRATLEGTRFQWMLESNGSESETSSASRS